MNGAVSLPVAITPIWSRCGPRPTELFVMVRVDEGQNTWMQVNVRCPPGERAGEVLA